MGIDNLPLPMTFVHSSFYRFTPVADPVAFAAWLREAGAALGGVILVAGEGLSAAIAGTPEAVQAFEAALQQQPGFAGLHVKHNACEHLPFSRLKVSTKREIVAFGVPGVSGGVAGNAPDTHVSPQRWRELLDDPGTVVLDNRNTFEFKLGRFRGAVDPGVAHFRDFPAFVAAHRDEWQGKTVAMYCTGGIRCEKTAAWMQSQGLAVAQLDGGILNYLDAFPGDAARDWQGECYVFDKRIAIDAQARETGTTAEQVFTDPADAWRLARAKRLDPAD